MTDWISITLIILSELALLQMIGLGVYAWRRSKGSSMSLKTAKKLLLSLRNDPQHRETLHAFLQSTYCLDEDALATSTAVILGEEKALIKTILKSIATNNLAEITTIREQMVVLRNHGGPLSQVLKNKHAQHTQKLEAMIQVLQGDLEKLSGELEATLSTMERTLSEYANMYSVKTNDDDKGLSALRGIVGNAKQHATNTLKKLADDLQENKVIAAALTETVRPDGLGAEIDLDKKQEEFVIDLDEPGLPSKALLTAQSGRK